MAYTEERFFTRGTKFGKDWRISVLQDGGAGASDRITAKDTLFTKRYALSNDRDFWKQKIIEPVLEITILFDPDTDLSFYRGIVESPDDTYRLKFAYDGSTDVIGSVRGDKITIDEKAAAKTVVLRAQPLVVQRGDDYPLRGSATNQEYAILIGDILNQNRYDLPIYTYGDWTSTSAGFDNTDDYFNQAALDTYHLRNYAGNRSDDENIKYFDALKEVIPDGHFIFMKNGAWHLISLPYIARQGGESVERYKYTWGGALYAKDSKSTVDLTETFTSGNYLLRHVSNSKHFAGVKDIKQRYNHKTFISSISFEPSYLHEDISDSPSEEEMENFESDGNQRLEIRGQVRVKTDDTGTNQKSGTAELLIQAGDREYDLTNDSWPTSGDVVELPLFGSGQVLTHDISIDTTVIPSGEEGLTVSLRWASDDGQNTSWNTEQVEWKDMSVHIINGSEAADNASIHYKLTQDQDYNAQIELPDRIFGQGPTAYSRSAIRYLATNYDRIATWKRKGEAGTMDYVELLMGDIMNTQRNSIRVIQAELWTEFNIGDVVEYESEKFIILAGDFTGRTQKWNTLLYQLNYETDV